MAPIDITALSDVGVALITLAIGFGFGFVLEQAGFGDSRRLAAQFYLTDMRVLKVMFTGIIVAMLLIFGSAAVGLLDYDALWVNPTFLWSGILGGLLLGMGFIIGGFCPGTSIVAAATLKLDGLIFLAGAFFGVFVFGEVVPDFRIFWEQSGAAGRVTLFDFLGLPAGVTVFLVILMALGMFWGAEKLEKIFGGRPQ